MDCGKLSLTPAKQLKKRELVLLFPKEEIPRKKENNNPKCFHKEKWSVLRWQWFQKEVWTNFKAFYKARMELFSFNDKRVTMKNPVIEILN